MSDIVIQVDSLSKQYRLGQIGGTTLREDFSRWWARVRHQPDPTLKVTEVNVRDRKAPAGPPTEHTEHTDGKAESREPTNHTNDTNGGAEAGNVGGALRRGELDAPTDAPHQARPSPLVSFVGKSSPSSSPSVSSVCSVGKSSDFGQSCPSRSTF